MKEAFVSKRFSASTQRTIDQANEIMAEYEASGFDLSLRQLYYQYVARSLIENSERSYKGLGSIISDARLAGLIDWDMIKDRGRETVEIAHWDSPKEILETAAAQFRIDKWANQPVRVEVMVEKQALEGVLIPVCKRLDVPFTANKGYSSSSALYEIGKKLEEHCGDGKVCHVIYLGDHDPSGVDMTRDVRDRLRLFARYDDQVQVHRLALTMGQIRRYNPPPNPTKIKDSRAGAYIRQFGDESWELDALDPKVLAELVSGAVADHGDPELWQEMVAREQVMREQIQGYADAYVPPEE